MTAARTRSAAIVFTTLLAFATIPSTGVAKSQRRGGDGNEVSPARQIERRDRSDKRDPEFRSRSIRSIDGSHNNVDDTEMGAADTPLFRLVAADYADGVAALAGADRAGARAISNAVSAQPVDVPPNGLGATDFLWQWGQFVDHDIDLTDGADPAEPAEVAVPLADPFFDPQASGVEAIAFNRSIHDLGSGTGTDNPRQQLNEITAWIDASNVYGSDEVRAAALRKLDGSGELKESTGRLLPYNEPGLPNAGGSGAGLFLAGDVRANEQVGLTALHTLFVREHNRLARSLSKRLRDASGERIYQHARRLVAAQMQAITYEEFLPALLGPNAIPPYSGYDEGVDARIANVFSAAAYRFGHSALSPTLLRLDRRGNESDHGHLALRDAFFRPDRISDEGGIEPLLRGLAAQACQSIDLFVIDDVRNFLFGAPGAGGFDLAALNIQRGRDHGLPSYNDVRESLGLGRAASFGAISDNPEVQDRLASVYSSPDDVDVWVGGLAEGRVAGSHLGPLFTTLLIEQFTALRDGDRFWYERDLSRDDLREIRKTRLSDVIRRNTGIRDEIQDDVFRIAAPAERRSRHSERRRR